MCADRAPLNAGDAAPLRIVYDVSPLGGPAAMNRTGLFRTARSIAAGLAQRDDCRVWLTAPESFDVLDRCLNYVPSDPQLSNLPFLLPPLVNVRRRLFRTLADLQEQAVGADEWRALVRTGAYGSALRQLKPHTRVLRRTTSLASRLVGTATVPATWQHDVKPHVYHSPFGPLPDVGPGIARFLMVHDLIPIVAPQYCTAAQQAYLRRVLASVSENDWILTNSHATKATVCDVTRIDPRRVFVTQLAADPALFGSSRHRAHEVVVRRRYQIPQGPYFLSLSTFEPRKNMAHVIRCFARFVQQSRVRNVSLVLAGPEGWDNRSVREAANAVPGLRSRIIFTGYVADYDLAPLYAGALAFIFASLEEGFGLPALEAMQCGTPVVYSRLAALLEVVGDAGLSIDPHDADALCDSMQQLFDDDARRADLSGRALARAAQFSWDRCVTETVAAYRAAIS